jgi:N12 class adenine-specific DNA methylase
LIRLDEAIEEAWADGERSTAKRLETIRKQVYAKLSRLTDGAAKDQNITFEQLGIDAIVCDESQAWKNLFMQQKCPELLVCQTPYQSARWMRIRS